jgi:hypothetical protein
MCNFVEMLWKKDKNQEEKKVIHCQQPKEKNLKKIINSKQRKGIEKFHEH